MAGSAAKVTITERQQDTLNHLIRSSTTSQSLVTRCRIVLLAFEKFSNEEISRQVGLERHAVGLWRRRWRDSWEALIPEEFGSQPQLERAIARVLSDAPRCGTTPKFTAEQVTQILALACEPPEDSGRPVTHWTPRELAEETVERGIVESISVRQVGRFLKTGRTQTAPQ